MRILALEPYYGGSHRAFLDAWIRASRHRWTLLTLPPYKWKWRMRHGAWTLARQVGERLTEGEGWDLLFASDMLDLATFKGLAPGAVHRLPSLIYFHENQLTYPVQVEKERDLHFALTNLSTALAADQLWFNSAFHRDDFLAAIPALLKRMPDHRPETAVEEIRQRARVEHPGIDPPAPRAPRRGGGPLHILWAARWEFDKGPETFFRALARLERRRVPFRLSVLGESFRRTPAIFAEARQRFAPHIEQWGFLAARRDYLAALAAADVFVSTAQHEFFGLAAAEAMVAGCHPLLPERLAYPELLANLPPAIRQACLYGGSARQLAVALEDLAHRQAAGERAAAVGAAVAGGAARFLWRQRRPQLDAQLAAVARIEAQAPVEVLA